MLTWTIECLAPDSGTTIADSLYITFEDEVRKTYENLQVLDFPQRDREFPTEQQLSYMPLDGYILH